MSEMKTKRDKIDTWISKESGLKSSIQAFENNKTLIEEFSAQELEYASNIEKMINEKNTIIVSKKESEDNKKSRIFYSLKSIIPLLMSKIQVLKKLGLFYILIIIIKYAHGNALK